jgi:type IV secretion system protein TrbB
MDVYMTSSGTTARADAQRRGAAERHARYLGPEIARFFDDPDVTEVYVNPDGRLRVDTHSRGKVDTGILLSSERIEMFLNSAASETGAVFDGQHPRLQAELPHELFGGARLQGFRPPVAAGPCFVVRRPPSVIHPLASYVERGMLAPAWCERIRAAISARDNILVVGGTATGKTTFANALIHEIATQSPTERLVILEDTVELQCAAPDHVALRTSPQVPLPELVRSTLRARPDRIVVGEVRGAEALDLLDAWATGHPGGVGTLHASSVEGALLRIDRLAQRAGVPPQRELVAEAVRLVVLLEGGNRATSATRTSPA